MKKIVILTFVFASVMGLAQNISTIETRALMRHLEKPTTDVTVSDKIIARYPVQTVKGQKSIGVIAQVNARFNAADAERMGIKVTSRIADIVVMRSPLDRLPILNSIEGIELFTVAHRAVPHTNNTRFDTRTDSVQNGYGTPMPFNGDGVLIGITDWGFDYAHPNLTSKSNPRIVRAWDHFKLSGPAPEGFDYGTEYKTDDELREAQCDTFGLYGYGTHGTHVAGICGGRGIDGNYVGQAPGAKYILGSWYLDEASWLDQIAWMKRVAQEEGKRLVVNNSWGMYTFSANDGTSLLSRAINSYSDSGIVFVTSAGNNGARQFHLHHIFGKNDTLLSVAEYLQSTDCTGEALMYWGKPGHQFKAAFKLISKTDTNDVVMSPTMATSDNMEFTESFLIAGGDTVHYDVTTESANPLNQRPHVILNVELTEKYDLLMMCIADSGADVHVWNVGNIVNNAGNTGAAFKSMGLPGAKNGDNEYGIGEPACAAMAISVAAHNADRVRSNGEVIEGTLASFSSHGPALGEGIKPEISAPGVGVISSISSYTTTAYDAVYETRVNRRRYIWSSMQGTSMSSPAVTGVVALMLQANPHLTVRQIRDILFTTARNDGATGALHANDSVSLRWGYGKVDALRAVNAAYDLLSVDEAAELQPALVVFPNPANTQATILTGTNQPSTLQLYNVNGQLVQQCNVSSEHTIDLSNMERGVYVVRVSNQNGVRSSKIVVK